MHLARSQGGLCAITRWIICSFQATHRAFRSITRWIICSFQATHRAFSSITRWIICSFQATHRAFSSIIRWIICSFHATHRAFISTTSNVHQCVTVKFCTFSYSQLFRQMHHPNYKFDNCSYLGYEESPITIKHFGYD